MNIERTTLLDTLERLVVCAGDARTFPIVGCVVVHDGAATTTNMDTFAVASLGVDTPTFAVDCRRLLSIVKSLDGDDVTLDVVGHDVNVKSGRASYKLHGWDVKDFPAVPTAHFTHVISDDVADVFRLAAKMDTATYGVRLAVDGDEHLSIAATDGYRLALRGSMDAGVGVGGSAVRMLANVSITGIGWDDNWVYFEDEATGTVYGARRHNGGFPDVGKALATARANATGTAHVNGGRLRDALGRVALLADGETSRIDVEFKAGALTLRAASDNGNASDALPYEGDAAVKTALNWRYLADWAKFAGDDVQIVVNGSPGSPVLLEGNGLAGTSYVLMPMR